MSAALDVPTVWVDGKDIDHAADEAQALAAGISALNAMTGGAGIDLYVQTYGEDMGFVRVRMTGELLATIARRYAFCRAECVIEARQHLDPASWTHPNDDGTLVWSLNVWGGKFNYQAPLDGDDEVRSHGLGYMKLARLLAQWPDVMADWPEHGSSVMWPFGWDGANLFYTEGGHDQLAEFVVATCPEAGAKKRAYDMATQIATNKLADFVLATPAPAARRRISL